MTTKREPGRELDAEVAEKVMGMVDNRPTGEAGEMWGIMDWYAPGRPAWAANFPAYSTDVAAAWEVVEKAGLSLLRTDDGWLAFDPGVCGQITYPEPGVCNGIVDLEILVGTPWAVAPTAPHAICLAALAAIEASP